VEAYRAIVKTTMKSLRRSLGTAQAKKAPATNVVAQRIAFHHSSQQDQPGRQRTDHRNPARCRAVLPCAAVAGGARRIEGAPFRQVRKGGKRIGERLGGRAYYDIIKAAVREAKLFKQHASVGMY
jgi:hypothetical protein